MPSNETPHNDSRCDSFIYNRNVVPVLYFLMLPIALMLNSVAAWVCLHLKSTTTFVVYLKNLVVADIIMIFIIPFTVLRGLPGMSNLFYVLSCRYFSSIFYSTQYTCIGLLGFIGMDRFFKIMMPQSKLLCQNLTISKLLSGSVWVILFGGTALPNIILSNKSLTNITVLSTCMMLKGSTGRVVHHWIIINMNVFFWIVSVVIAFCYICIANKVIQSFRNSGSSNNQGNKRIKLRTFLLVFVFYVSFAPYHIVRIPYTFQQASLSSNASCSYILGKFAKDLSLWFAATNVCMNPLLYVFLCREFNEKLMSLMKNVSTSLKVVSEGKAEATE